MCWKLQYVINLCNDLYDKVLVPNETKDLNLHVFNMVIGINESKTLTRHISCKCECKFNGRKCNFNQKCYEDKCWCECKNSKEHHGCKKIYFFNPATCSCANGKYARSIGDLVIVYNVIIEETKSTLTNVIPEKAIPRKIIPAKYTLTKFYILLAFLFITITLLIAVSIYLIKHLSIQKHLLPFNDTSKSKEIDIKNILYKMESNNKF